MRGAPVVRYGQAISNSGVSSTALRRAAVILSVRISAIVQPSFSSIKLFLSSTEPAISAPLSSLGRISTEPYEFDAPFSTRNVIVSPLSARSSRWSSGPRETSSAEDSPGTESSADAVSALLSPAGCSEFSLPPFEQETARETVSSIARMSDMILSFFISCLLVLSFDSLITQNAAKVNIKMAPLLTTGRGYANICL